MVEWAAGLAETAEERQQLCNTGIDAFCEMLFVRPALRAAFRRRRRARFLPTLPRSRAQVHNFVHGDLHPGNVLVTTTADGSPRLAFLDAGIVVSYSEFDHGMLIDILGPSLPPPLSRPRTGSPPPCHRLSRPPAATKALPPPRPTRGALRPAQATSSTTRGTRAARS